MAGPEVEAMVRRLDLLSAGRLVDAAQVSAVEKSEKLDKGSSHNDGNDEDKTHAFNPGGAVILPSS